MDGIISSISKDEGEILRSILTLHVPAGVIDLDPTYSKGKFYRYEGLSAPLLRYDIDPEAGVEVADVRALPLPDASVGSVMFDPPFLATTGPSLGRKDANNLMVQRFGVYKSEEELHRFYTDALNELARVIWPDGVLVVKCQDKVSSGRQYFSHILIYMAALRAGFYAKDLFVLEARSRLVAPWQRNQQHARKFHSYFWVFTRNTSFAEKQRKTHGWAQQTHL